MKRLNVSRIKTTLFHGLFVTSKSLIFRTLHNNTIINKIVSQHANFMFHALIFYNKIPLQRVIKSTFNRLLFAVMAVYHTSRKRHNTTKYKSIQANETTSTHII